MRHLLIKLLLILDAACRVGIHKLEKLPHKKSLFEGFQFEPMLQLHLFYFHAKDDKSSKTCGRFMNFKKF